jgi:steroid delta-isomerase-like uncharacterized protein
MSHRVEENAALARRWFEEVWNQRRTATVHELLRPDSVGHLQSGDVVGPEPFLEVHAQLLQALPDLRVQVEDTVAQGDHVVVRWTATGTHQARGMGCDPAGTQVQFRGMTWIRYHDGKMVEGWDAWDLGGLMQKLRGQS